MFYTADQFEYSCSRKTASAEASPFGNFFAGRVFVEDTEEKGIVVHSRKTGEAIVLVHTGTEYTGTGSVREIASWIFEPVTITNRRVNPLVKLFRLSRKDMTGWQFVIFND